MARRVLLALVALMLILAACAEEDPATDADSAGGSGSGSEAEETCDVADPPTMTDGVLTVATDKPAFPPWFEGSPKNYSGFEGDLANEVAERMDLDIEWVVEPFNKSYAPGAKDYDFDINQISITPEREEAVDFSDGYFQNNQGILAAADSSIADATTLEDLKEFKLGAQVGTTGLDFINTVIQPNEQAQVFDTTNDAKSALQSGQLDALVTDVVTTVYLRDFEIEGTEVIGQYPSEEQFGMLFESGNPLVDCVNQVLGEIRDDGTLDQLQEQWLQDYLGVPTIEG
ncbi:MAG TPA: ABC transporter substrate-binding protein [Actinomycetota bacterium]|nr:ABC transporter substrate-binding protein [Actinomycetota bacterium]